MTRNQLDAGVPRDNYWAVIADRYNSPSLRPAFSFVGRVDEADSAAIPPCIRLPGTLKSHFIDNRGKFTIFLNRWSQSGQNDSEKFAEFIPKVGGRLSALSKRLYVIFSVCKLGTPYADYRLLEASSKLMPRDMGCDEGFPTPAATSQLEGNYFGQENRKDAPESSGSRKRKRNSQSGLEEKVGDICQTLNSYVTESRKTQEDSNPMLKKWKEQDEMMKLLKSAHQATEEAKALASGNHTIVELSEMVYKSREKAVKEALSKTL